LEGAIGIDAPLGRSWWDPATLIELVPVLMWASDAGGQCVFLNNAWTKFTGQPVRSGLGWGFLDAVHPEDRLKIKEAWANARAQVKPYQAEYRLLSTDGSYHWMIDTAAPQIGLSGELLGFVGTILDNAERHAAETAHRRGERRLEIALDAAQLGIWEWDLVSNEFSFSNTASDIFGFEQSGSISFKQIEAVMHPDDIAAVQAISAAALDPERRTSEPYRYRIIRADGQVRWIQAHGEALFLEVEGKTKPQSYIGTFQDITDQVNAQTQVRESEERLRLALEAGGIAVWELNTASNAVTHSPELNALYGFPLDATPSLAEFRSRYAPGEQERLAELGQQALARGQTEIITEVRHILPEEKVRWLYLRAKIGTPTSSGDPRVIGVVMDVTGQKLAEERLRELNAELEQRVLERTADRDRVWTMSRDLFAVMGFDGFLKEINPAWEVTLGRDTATLLSLPFPEQVHPDDHQLIAALVQRLRSGETVERFEDRLRHADGSWRWISWTLVPADDVFYAVGRDVTEEKARREELEQAQEALRQAQKMEAVGQLTGGLAHDFNNIIAGISGSLEMMSARLAQGRIGDLDRYIAGASGAAKRAAGLTQRLLAFSRRQTLEPKPTNLNTLVNGMLDLINRSAGPEIHVETAGATGLWTTFVDAGQLENALLNLCINARDAMPDGGKLTIETANRWMDERGARQHGIVPGQYISLCVSDTGTGMPPEVIERAFDPFFTTKPIGQGTGLGLSMVYGFAGQSGGTVRIYSEMGKGTMVCISLPRHAGEAAQEDELHGVDDAPRAEGGETVLLVDDEPLVRMIASEALEELGYTVIEAGDGATALKILNSDQTISLLVTDVGLPGGINGRQVADAARVARPDLKVLFITGYAENAVLNHGHLDRGMHVLTKPFQMDAFARRVKDLIADP
jgi:PAS domain S-box-containing protein